MKDLRFTGSMHGDNIDVRFRTDMANATDERFNINQIQTGLDFEPNDKQDAVYQKNFGVTFVNPQGSLSQCKQFAIDNGLNLRLYHEDGTVESLVHDHSDSTSDNN